MTDVFISYSRLDADFVHRLDDVLKKQGRDIWVDWEDIPVTSEWWCEIQSGIEAADTYIFVITQNSLQSPVCNLELAHAISNNKRIVPIIRQRADEKAAFALMAAVNLNETVQAMFTGRDPLIIARDNWHALSERNWLFFDQDDAFDVSLAKLVEVLATDLDRVRLHTHLLIRAREWDARGRDPSFLLQGTELQEAQAFLAQSASKEPAALPIQGDYILASQRREAERQQHEQTLDQRARRRGQILIAAGVIVSLLIFVATLWIYTANNNVLTTTTRLIS